MTEIVKMNLRSTHCRTCRRPIKVHRRTGSWGKTEVHYYHEMGVKECGHALPMIYDEYIFVLVAKTPYDGIELIGTFNSLEAVKTEYDEVTWTDTETGITAVFPDEIVVEAIRSVIKF